MPGRTRLYQRAGSPLIHGHSKRERAAWRDWVSASAASVAGVYVAQAVSSALGPANRLFDRNAATEVWLVGPMTGIVAAIPAAACGVWLSRALGWRHPWLAGAALGIGIGVTVVLVGSETL